MAVGSGVAVGVLVLGTGVAVSVGSGVAVGVLVLGTGVAVSVGSGLAVGVLVFGIGVAVAVGFRHLQSEHPPQTRQSPLPAQAAHRTQPMPPT